MRQKYVGNKRDSKLVVVRNDDTVTIPRGTPLVLQLSSTADDGDGLAVLLPSSTSAALSDVFGYGVATADIPVNGISEAIVSGYVAYALITQLTRSASSAVWPSYASSASAILQIDTLNNAFLMASISQALQNYLPFAVLLDSIAGSSTTSASTSSGPGTVTASIVAHRVFVRML